MIKNIEQIDWNRIVQFCSTETNEIMKKLEIPESEDTFGVFNYLIEHGIIEFIKQKLYSLFILHLNKLKGNDTKSRKAKIIKNMLRRAESEVKTIREIIEVLLDVGSLKWIKDSDAQKSIRNELEKRLSKYIGQKFSEGNLKLYGKILKKNDEYIKNGEESNYSKAAKNVTKLYDVRFKNFYKAFDNFKERHNIRTYKDFKNSIYYTRVDKSSPPA